MVDKTVYVQRLKVLFQQKTGILISDAEALVLFERLVALVEAVYSPIPKEQ